LLSTNFILYCRFATPQISLTPPIYTYFSSQEWIVRLRRESFAEAIDMQDSINLQSRNYMGKGKLQICSSDITDSDISIYFRNDGKHTITCWFYLINEYAIVLSDILEKQKSTPVYATFSGEDSEGVNISIDKMVLNETNFSANTTTTDPKYIIHHDLLLSIFSKIGKTLFAAEIASQNFLNIVRLEFIMLSNIRIQYRKLSDDESVRIRWGLANFYFGSEGGQDRFFADGEDVFSLNVSGNHLEIKKVPDYSNILSQLKFNNNVNVTCEAHIDTEYSKLADFKTTLDHICMLVSFADCNWVTPLYTDIYKDDKIAETILLYHKQYPFTKGRKSVINIGHPNAKSSVRDFVDESLETYKYLRDKFGLHKVIEYYISAETNGIVHERFDIAYIALECLCSSVRERAEENGETITISDIQETEDKLRSLLKNLKEQISEESLKTLSKELAYKYISIRDEQYFAFDKFGIRYDRKTIKELYDVRNALFHGGDFDYTELFKRTVQLFDLLDRTILTMLGWKGKSYVSKSQGYTLAILE
jgi:hypothetical protein